MQKGSTLNEDDLLDPENIIYDDDGNVAGVYDPETGEKRMYNSDGDGGGDDPPAPADPKDKGNQGGGQQDPPKGEEPPKKKEGEDKTPEYLNHADFILKEGGYELDEIEFEDGRKVKIADLSPEDQLNIVTNEFQRMREEFQAEIEKAPETAFQNEEEKELISFLRNGGTAKDLAQYIIENDPDNAHKALTDDDLVLENLRTQYPGASEEDIQEEFKVLKDAGRVEKRAQFLRQKLNTGEIKFSDISAAHKEKMDAQRNKSIESERESAAKIIDYAKNVKEIAGIPVDSTVTAGLVKDLVPENLEDDSEFLKTLDQPENLLRLRFLDVHAEKIFQHISDQSFKDGMLTERERLQAEISELKAKLNIQDAHLRKFSDSPIIKFTNNKNANPRKDQRREEEEVF